MEVKVEMRINDKEMEKGRCNGCGIITRNSVKAVTLLICYIAITAIAAQAVQISVLPSSQTVPSGGDFTVDIYVDPEGSAVGGVDYILCFNNTLLNGTLLTKGTFFDGFDTMEYGDGINNTLGNVDYGECIWPITGEGVTTPNTLTTITFQAIAEHGVDELYFKKVTVCDPGGIKIPTNVSSGSVRIGICGNVNGDAGVDMGDVILLANYVGYPGEYTVNEWAANVNDDGGMDMGDVILLANYVGYPGLYELNCKS